VSTPVVFLAPGAGLGHLVRACALALSLDEFGIPSCIAASSPFAGAVRRIVGLDIVTIPPNRWARAVHALLDELRPGLAVLDTFPAGFRGEWRTPAHHGTRRCYLARRLRVHAYARALGCALEDILPTIPEDVILLEPLEARHRALLEAASAHLHLLPGPVRLDLPRVPPVPPRLHALLETGCTRLVVHSGPRHECARLVRRARRDLRPGERIALVAPIRERIGVETFDYFPASRLFSRACHVYTGAGYNSMAEGVRVQEKHTAVAFARRYDDQAARARVRFSRATGTRAAAEVLAGLA